MTRMAGQADDERSDDAPMAPDLVAPMVAFLAHEDCPVSGEIYAAGAGRFARIFIASTVGYVHAEGEPTIEDVAAHWAAINDETGYYVPADLMDWSAAFTAHLALDRIRGTGRTLISGTSGTPRREVGPCGDRRALAKSRGPKSGASLALVLSRGAWDAGLVER